MFGLTLVGKPRPLALDEVPANTPSDYRELMTMWGPGRIAGLVELPDPREPAGRFADLQQRFRLHAPGHRALGRWRHVDDELQANGVVIARLCRRDGAWVASAHGIVEVRATDDWRWSTIASWVERNPWPAVRIYQAGPSLRGELYAALRARDEAAADAWLPRIYEQESAWAILEIALALATELVDIDPEARADMFDRCMRYAKRDDDRVPALPVRAMREAIKTRSLSPDHARALAELVHVDGTFHGPTSETERQLAGEIIASPHDRAACTVLADHLEASGLLLRAKWMRDQAGAMSPSEAAALGLAGRPVDADEILQRWAEAWRADDFDTSIDDLWTSITGQTEQVRRAIVSGLVYRSLPILQRDPAVTLPFAILGLRSKENENCADAIGELRLAKAAPWLLQVMRVPSFVEQGFRPERKRPDGRHDMRLDFALAFHASGAKLTKADIDEALGWLDGDIHQRLATLCLLHRSPKDDRVLEACLARFTEGHPYSERVVTRRKADPRVLPALLATFDKLEKTVLVDGGKRVHYTEPFRIIARYLAKLGNERGKAAWERCKLKGRIDRADADREMRREWRDF